MPAPATKITPMQPRIRRPAPNSSRREEDCVCLTADSLHDLASPINQVCSLSELILKKSEGSFEEETQSPLRPFAEFRGSLEESDGRNADVHASGR